MNRSYLFVPADSERKLKRAGQAGADALILDLEDSVAADARPAAREQACGYLEGRDNAWVRINPLDTDHADADLEAVMPAAPAGIVLPKAESGQDITHIQHSIGFVQDEHFDTRQVDGAIARQIEEAARASNNDLCTAP